MNNEPGADAPPPKSKRGIYLAIAGSVLFLSLAIAGMLLVRSYSAAKPTNTVSESEKNPNSLSGNSESADPSPSPGDSRSSSTPTASPTPTQVASPPNVATNPVSAPAGSATPAPSNAPNPPKTYDISYKNGCYGPANATVKQGDSVKFTNNSSQSMWPASDNHPSHTIYSEFDSKGSIAPGGTYTFIFTRIGSWGYHDHLKPGCTGTISVN